MKLYNTLTRKLEAFEPLRPPAVGMYVCGPTVYDVPHIGHLRSAYTFDVLRRYLTSQGLQVTFVRNVTDVDDKIIDKARQEEGPGDLNAKCRDVSQRYLHSYHEKLAQFGILPPDQEPKATNHVVPDEHNVKATRKIDASMTGFISQLITKNMAYPAGGDVYFAVRKFEGYGRLSNRTLDDLKSGARVEPDEHKEDPLDFALWKASKPGEPSWNSPWGPGRPGWHIECSVMSTAYLGDEFDIHGGGVDLVFPHHENEIAQAQALGKPFARYWVHNGLLTVNGEKMSKSLGNYTTVEKALEQCFGKTDVIKMFFLGAHYRSPLDYTTQSLEAARKRHLGMLLFLEYADKWRSSAQDPQSVQSEMNSYVTQFASAMDEDLNTPQALAVLDALVHIGTEWEQSLHDKSILRMTPPWELSKGIEYKGTRQISEKQTLSNKIVCAADTLIKLGGLLGLFHDTKDYETVSLTPDQENLLEQRRSARLEKDFKLADQIRKKFEEQNLLIEDKPNGKQVIRRKR